MPDVASHLRDAGFNDDEISSWAMTTRENLKAAGFEDSEVDAYLGLPKTPDKVPDAFIERFEAGRKLVGFYNKIMAAVPEAKQTFSEMHPAASAAASGAVEAFGNEPLGLDPEKEREVYKMLGIPEGMMPLVSSLPSAQILKGGAAALDLMMRGTNAGIRAVAEAAGETSKELGQNPAMAERMKRDINSLGQIAMLLAGPMHADVAGMTPMRMETGPAGERTAQQIGGLPRSEDFSTASTAIGHGDPMPATETKLLDLYEKKGIHPAEVAHDAQTDVTITQSILSADKEDVPAVYAHHGSPYDFEKFDISKIGAGEGSQSYGHGLYFAENPKVAESYQKQFEQLQVDGGAVDTTNPRHLAIEALFKSGEIDFRNPPAQARKEAQAYLLSKGETPAIREAIDLLKYPVDLEGGAVVPGNSYRVRIKADPNTFIDWDKPLAEQSDFIKEKLKVGLSEQEEARLKELEAKNAKYLSDDETREVVALRRQRDKGKMTGREYHELMAPTKGSEIDFANAHAEMGISGIKYLDQGSRAPGEGTHNYVVFDDKNVEITHKNGDLVAGPERQKVVEDILTERQPSSAGAAAVTPPSYSDAEQQILSKISIDEKAPEAKLTWDKLYTRAVDKLFPLAKEVKEIAPDLPAEDNPYQLARLLSGHVGKADHFLNQATFDFHTYEANGPSLKEILAPVKNDLNGFRAYAASARALELEGRGIKSGFDTGEASAPPLVSAGLDAARTVVVEGREKFEAPFRALIDYQNRVSGYLRDSGVLSDAGYKAMVEANKMYVPFTRVMGLDQANERFRVLSGPTMQASNPIKDIKGSARAIVDPLESVVRNTYHMIQMAEKNVVGTKLVDMLKGAQDALPEAPKAAEAIASKDTPRAGAMAEALGEVGVKKPDELAAALAHATEPLREGEIAILRDGKRETYKVDPELANAMKGLDAQSIGMLERALTYPASVLRAGAVTTPDFALRHTIRDFLYAATTFKEGMFTPLDMAKGFAGLIMKDADYWNWLKGGGGNISMVGLDRQYLQTDLRELTGKTGLVGRAWNVMTDPNSSMWQKTSAVGTLPFQAIDKFILDPLRTLTQLAENASHLGAFKKTMRGMEESGPQDLRSQIIRSAWLSRDTAVDAARMGASMRAYNMITAFANIKLQDTDRVVRAIKDNPVGTLTKIGGAITVPSVILWSINHDDPDYQYGVAQWEKDMFWIVPIGSTAPSPLHIQQAQERGVAPTNSALFFARVPKPWAMGMIFGTAPERLLDAYVDHKPEAFRDYFKKLWETSGPEFVPTGAAPIIDQFANRSTFTNRTLIPAAQEKFLPEYQYTPYTTELSKQLGQVVGAFPGMTTLKMDNSGWGGVARAMTSPILIENYVRGWTGTLGNYAMQAADLGLRKAGILPDPVKPASTLADIPIIRAFVVRYPSATAESVQQFQDEYAKAKSLFTTYQAMAKDGNVAAMQHIRDMTDDATLFGQLDGMHQTVSNLNQMVRDVYKNPDIPADEKRQLIDQMYFGMIQVSRAGMQTIHQIRDKAANTVPTVH